MMHSRAAVLLCAVLLMGCTRSPLLLTAPDGETQIHAGRCTFHAWVPQETRTEYLTYREDVTDPQAKALLVELLTALQEQPQIGGNGSAFDPQARSGSDCTWGLYLDGREGQFYYTMRVWQTQGDWEARFYDMEQAPSTQMHMCFATLDRESGRERAYELPDGADSIFRTALLYSLPEDAFLAGRVQKGEESTPKSQPFLLIKQDEWWEDRSVYTLYDLSGQILHYTSEETDTDEDTVLERMVQAYADAESFDDAADPAVLIRAYIQSLSVPDVLSYTEPADAGEDDAPRTTLYLVRDGALLSVAEFGPSVRLPADGAALAMMDILRDMCDLPSE